MRLDRKNNSKLLKKAPKLMTTAENFSYISEQFRTIRANITFSMRKQGVKTLLVTSATPGEGKSTNAANLAVVFAQEGKRVLLIDADMRKPVMHYTFRLMNGVGLSNVLTTMDYFEYSIQETFIDGLSVITSGPIPKNPAELLSSNNLKLLVKELEKQFDLIIFDAPPILAVSDAQILSNQCDGTILVVSAGKVDKSGVIKAKTALQSSQANVLGVIVNNFKQAKGEYYYYR
ncbi:MAG TPA: CpsD/CapB family tyrosine-protein kinase [Ureibacillus sp.]|nr:CpsD/CapB family tyrosine-protein kinase [Ureibacillus sp.]